MIAAATAISRAAQGVDVVDRVRGLDEDPVRVGRRADVDLDAPPQARDVAAAAPGRWRPRRAADEQASGIGRPARTPRRCGPRRTSARHAAASSVVSAAARSYAAQGGDVPAATLGAGPDELEGGDDARRSGPSAAAARCQASRSGSPIPARARPAPGARAAVARRWRPGRAPSAPADGAPAPSSASATSSPEATAASSACSSSTEERPRPGVTHGELARCRRRPRAAARACTGGQPPARGRGRPARPGR